MRSLIIISVFLWANVAFAQNNKKLEKLYRNKNYEKLLTKITKAEKKGKIITADAATFRILAYLGTNISLSDSVINHSLIADATVLKDSKQKNALNKKAFQQYKGYLLKTVTSFQKSNDSIALRQQALLLINLYADSTIFKRYFFPKKAAEIAFTSTKTKKLNRDSIIAYANSLLGTPYKWAGMNPKTGFDCSGFTCYVYKKAGKELIHFAKEQAKEGIEKSWKNAEKGDLIFFGKRYENGRLKVEHVGIFHSINDNGNPIILHSTNQGVICQEIKPNDYWSKKLLFCRNILDEPMLTNK
jgi:cell wall-associated NlpC family hydrolase